MGEGEYTVRSGTGTRHDDRADGLRRPAPLGTWSHLGRIGVAAARHASRGERVNRGPGHGAGVGGAPSPGSAIRAAPRPGCESRGPRASATPPRKAAS